MSVVVIARLSNLSTSVTESHLRELIERFAKVKQIIMPSPVLWLSCPTGRAEVIGETIEDTKLVYVHLHGSILDGNRVNVSFAKIGYGLKSKIPTRRSYEEKTHRRRDESIDRRRDRRKRYRSRDHYDRKRERRRSTRRSSSRSRRYRSRSNSVRSDSSSRDQYSSSRSRSPRRSRSPSWD